ncbi:LacI family DNA-binding transcriptional regulator [Mixta intestinalis]|jgi:LacI family gluconate utilization system Gnt-I transcriptional repressor|uniref:HTH-type transcriptional regulator GntR n=1 Tax=Mixta intestinalis TaxID=1615494 RepID=A0A6P1Q1E1_9GAMM|nr:LacI family DNA-binding transcriptional regulator [Mixta intestinalis]QHM72122.1 HTH-type transcriptional regulator GntR [Mixta intestinalis]
MRQRSRQIIKLDDVALQAGVSPSTVSLYIRQPERVSAKTGKKIQTAIDNLGYVHNKIASQFTGGRSSNMAVVLPSLANVIFSYVIQRIESTVSAQGFQLSIASHDHCLNKEEEQIRAILQWTPAVIAIAGADHKTSTLKMLQNSGVPVVQMWQVDGSAITAQVGNNHEQIGYSAAQYLLETGCEQLAYFTTRFNDDIRARTRYTGFCRALEERGKKPLLVDIPRSDNIWQASRETLMKTLVKEKGLDGIFCTSDSIATALLMEAQSRGIKVPDQLSILGFGDFPSSAWLSPVSLSSVSLNADMIAVKTAEMMLAMSQDKEYRGEVVNVGFEIIPRGSTRLPF